MRILFLSLSIVIGASLAAQEQYVTTSDSVRLYVHVKGEGLPCLYIHGGPGSGSHWLEVFMGDSLEQQFQMIYLDQRGVGRSSSPADHNYSLERLVKDFEEVRIALGIKQWLTIGHSFGGVLQMAYVKNCPKVIEGLMLVNCTLDMNDSFGNSWLPRAMALLGDETPKVCKDTTVSVYQRMLAVMPVLGQKGEMWKIFFNKLEDSRMMNETYSTFVSWNGDQSGRILEYEEYWQDFRRYSVEVNQPVLFYYGETDYAIGPEHYKAIRFPEVIVWGSPVGHMPFLEDKDDLMKAIRQYKTTYFR